MQLNSSAGQIEHRDERLGRVEAERSTSDHPQAIVGPLDNPIGQALSNIGEHTLLLGPDGSRDPDKGRELGTAGPGEPLIEGPSRPLGLPVVQRAGQGLGSRGTPGRAGRCCGAQRSASGPAPG